jgi:hypothetical protein
MRTQVREFRNVYVTVKMLAASIIVAIALMVEAASTSETTVNFYVINMAQHPR